MKLQAYSGYSLIELMISMSLGLILIAGLSQIYIGSLQSNKTYKAISEIQENARIAIDIISRQIRSAGYRPDPLAAIDIQHPAMPAESDIVYGIDNLQALGQQPGSDALLLAFTGAKDGSSRDCIGNSVDAGQESINRFYINKDHELRCSVNDASAQSTGQPIVEGISDMQFLYGVSNAACSNQASGTNPLEYFDASQINQWCSVRSVRMILTAESLTNVVPVASGDKRIKKSFTTTVMLRNR